MTSWWTVEDRLRTHLAENMVKNGQILSERHQSNEYCGMDLYKLKYRGNTWKIIFVDGMACRIDKE